MQKVRKGIVYVLAFNLMFLANPFIGSYSYSAVAESPVGQVTGVGNVTLTDSGKTVRVASLSRLVYPKSQIKTTDGEAYIRISKNVFNVFRNSTGTINSAKSIELSSGKLAFNISSGSEVVIQTPTAVIKTSKVMLSSLKPMLTSSNTSGVVTVSPDGKTVVSAVSGNLSVKNIGTGEEQTLGKGSSLTLTGTRTIMLAQVDDKEEFGKKKGTETEEANKGAGDTTFNRNALYGTIFGGIVLGGVIYAVVNNSKTPSR